MRMTIANATKEIEHMQLISTGVISFVRVRIELCECDPVKEVVMIGPNAMRFFSRWEIPSFTGPPQSSMDEKNAQIP